MCRSRLQPAPPCCASITTSKSTMRIATRGRWASEPRLVFSATDRPLGVEFTRNVVAVASENHMDSRYRCTFTSPGFCLSTSVRTILSVKRSAPLPQVVRCERAKASRQCELFRHHGKAMIDLKHSCDDYYTPMQAHSPMDTTTDSPGVGGPSVAHVQTVARQSPAAVLHAGARRSLRVASDAP